jgi:hypothetical protein
LEDVEAGVCHKFGLWVVFDAFMENATRTTPMTLGGVNRQFRSAIRFRLIE